MEWSFVINGRKSGFDQCGSSILSYELDDVLQTFKVHYFANEKNYAKLFME